MKKLYNQHKVDSNDTSLLHEDYLNKLYKKITENVEEKFTGYEEVVPQFVSKFDIQRGNKTGHSLD